MGYAPFHSFLLAISSRSISKSQMVIYLRSRSFLLRSAFLTSQKENNMKYPLFAAAFLALAVSACSDQKEPAAPAESAPVAVPAEEQSPAPVVEESAPPVEDVAPAPAEESAAPPAEEPSAAPAAE